MTHGDDDRIDIGTSVAPVADHLAPNDGPAMVIVAAALAAAIAVAWTVSPLTVIALVTLGLMCRRAVRDLAGRERQWVIGVLSIGVVARLAAVCAVFLTSNPETGQFQALNPDARFAIQRSLMLVNLWRGDEIGPWYQLVVFDAYGGKSYYLSLAIVQWFAGPSPYAIVLISVCAFTAAALVLFTLARSSLGPRAALAGFVVLMFWPTWFAWSVSMLKESVVLLMGTLVVWGGVRLIDHQRSWPVALVAMAAGVGALLSLREGVAAIPVAGTLVGLAAATVMRRSATTLAFGAACVLVLTIAATRPSAQAFVANQVRGAASRHIGHVNSPGYSYRIVDQRFYAGWPQASWTMQFDEGARFLLRAAAAFVLVPLPGQLPSASGVAFIPQQLAWYALVALALPGFWWGVRRAPQLTMALGGCCVVGLVVIAPNSGNIGTLIRHRDMIVPFLVWLSAAGAVRLAEG